MGQPKVIYLCWLICIIRCRLIEEERKENEKRRSAHKGRAKATTQDFDMEYFWDYEEIMEFVDQVAEEFSDIVTVHRLKDSYQGRRIVNIEITAPGTSDDRPIIFIDSTIHARLLLESLF